MDFEALIEKVKNIPYGRNSNRTDFSLVISENKRSASNRLPIRVAFSSEERLPDAPSTPGA